MAFCKEFNAKTQDKAGDILPVVITVYSDKSFTFITKQPPVSRMILKELGHREQDRKCQTAIKWEKSPKTQVEENCRKIKQDMRVAL